jgi:hypothetical protein
VDSHLFVVGVSQKAGVDVVFVILNIAFKVFSDVFDDGFRFVFKFGGIKFIADFFVIKVKAKTTA